MRASKTTLVFIAVILLFATGFIATFSLPHIAYATSHTTVVDDVVKVVENVVGGVITEAGSTALTPIVWLFQLLAHFLFVLAAILLTLVGFLFDFVVKEMVLEMGRYITGTQASAGIFEAWRTVRDVANIGIIAGLIAIAIGTIIQSSSLSAEKLLGRLIVAALLVNFSYFIAGAVIDASNFTASVIYRNIVASEEQCNKHLIARASCHLSSRIVVLAYIEKWKDLKPLEGSSYSGSAQVISERAGAEGAWYQVVSGYFAGQVKVLAFRMGAVIMLGMLLFIFISVIGMLVARFVALIFVLVTSPIGIAGVAIPKMEKYAKEWREALWSQAFFAPVFFLIVGLGLNVLENVGPAIKTSVEGQSQSLETVGILISFTLVIAIMLIALRIAKQMSERAKRLSEIYKAADTLITKPLGGFLWRATGGNMLEWARLRYNQHIAPTLRKFDNIPIIGRLGLADSLDRTINDALVQGTKAKPFGAPSYAEMKDTRKERRREVFRWEDIMEKRNDLFRWGWGKALRTAYLPRSLTGATEEEQKLAREGLSRGLPTKKGYKEAIQRYEELLKDTEKRKEFKDDADFEAWAREKSGLPFFDKFLGLRYRTDVAEERATELDNELDENGQSKNRKAKRINPDTGKEYDGTRGQLVLGKDGKPQWKESSHEMRERHKKLTGFEDLFGEMSGKLRDLDDATFDDIYDQDPNLLTQYARVLSAEQAQSIYKNGKIDKKIKDQIKQSRGKSLYQLSMQFESRLKIAKNKNADGSFKKSISHFDRNGNAVYDGPVADVDKYSDEYKDLKENLTYITRHGMHAQDITETYVHNKDLLRNEILSDGILSSRYDDIQKDARFTSAEKRIMRRNKRDRYYSAAIMWDYGIAGHDGEKAFVYREEMTAKQKERARKTAQTIKDSALSTAEEKEAAELVLESLRIDNEMQEQLKIARDTSKSDSERKAAERRVEELKNGFKAFSAQRQKGKEHLEKQIKTGDKRVEEWMAGKSPEDVNREVKQEHSDEIILSKHIESDQLHAYQKDQEWVTRMTQNARKFGKPGTVNWIITSSEGQTKAGGTPSERDLRIINEQRARLGKGELPKDPNAVQDEGDTDDTAPPRPADGGGGSPSPQGKGGGSSATGPGPAESAGASIGRGIDSAGRAIGEAAREMSWARPGGVSSPDNRDAIPEGAFRGAAPSAPQTPAPVQVTVASAGPQQPSLVQTINNTVINIGGGQPTTEQAKLINDAIDNLSASEVSDALTTWNVSTSTNPIVLAGLDTLQAGTILRDRRHGPDTKTVVIKGLGNDTVRKWAWPVVQALLSDGEIPRNVRMALRDRVEQHGNDDTKREMNNYLRTYPL